LTLLRLGVEHIYSSLSEDQRVLLTELQYVKLKALAEDVTARQDVDPDPDWIRMQRLCGSGSVLGIRIQGQEN
jgi:hypothetical protein